MFRIRTADARFTAIRCLMAGPAPRANGRCRCRAFGTIGFALTLLLVSGALPVTVASLFPFLILPAPAEAAEHGRSSGGDDALLAWREGSLKWADLRELASGGPDILEALGVPDPGPPSLMPASGPWKEGLLRVIHLGSGSEVRAAARAAARNTRPGIVRMLHDLDNGVTAQVLAVDQAGLRDLQDRALPGQLDRKSVV